MLLAEDATAQQCCADVMGMHKKTLIFGMNGPTITVHTAEEYQKLKADENASYATLLYVYTLVPLSKELLTFPYLLSAIMVPAGPSRQL